MVATAVLNNHRRAGALLHRLRRQQADGWRLKCKPVCASTEVELSHWLQSVPWRGERPRAVLADHQTRGQGQRGRRWEATRGGVWISAALPWDSNSGHADMLNTSKMPGTRRLHLASGTVLTNIQYNN